MTDLINPSIMPIINRNGMSAHRISSLIYLKEFVDRVSSKNYISKPDLEKLEKKYGIFPDIITWGDYFQADVATAHAFKDDDELLRSLNTIKFDIISSYLIFNDKGNDFYKWVDSHENASFSDAEISDEEREIEHLKILKQYYVEMGITNTFTEAEIAWHSSFSDAMAI